MHTYCTYILKLISMDMYERASIGCIDALTHRYECLICVASVPHRGSGAEWGASEDSKDEPKKSCIWQMSGRTNSTWWKVGCVDRRSPFILLSKVTEVPSMEGRTCVQKIFDFL